MTDALFVTVQSIPHEMMGSTEASYACQLLVNNHQWVLSAWKLPVWEHTMEQLKLLNILKYEKSNQ